MVLPIPLNSLFFENAFKFIEIPLNSFKFLKIPQNELAT